MDLATDEARSEYVKSLWAGLKEKEKSKSHAATNALVAFINQTAAILKAEAATGGDSAATEKVRRALMCVTCVVRSVSPRDGAIIQALTPVLDDAIEILIRRSTRSGGDAVIRYFAFSVVASYYEFLNALFDPTRHVRPTLQYAVCDVLSLSAADAAASAVENWDLALLTNAAIWCRLIATNTRVEPRAVSTTVGNGTAAVAPASAATAAATAAAAVPLHEFHRPLFTAVCSRLLATLPSPPSAAAAVDPHSAAKSGADSKSAAPAAGAVATVTHMSDHMRKLHIELFELAGALIQTYGSLPRVWSPAALTDTPTATGTDADANAAVDSKSSSNSSDIKSAPTTTGGAVAINVFTRPIACTLSSAVPAFELTGSASGLVPSLVAALIQHFEVTFAVGVVRAAAAAGGDAKAVSKPKGKSAGADAITEMDDWHATALSVLPLFVAVTNLTATATASTAHVHTATVTRVFDLLLRLIARLDVSNKAALISVSEDLLACLERSIQFTSFAVSAAAAASTTGKETETSLSARVATDVWNAITALLTRTKNAGSTRVFAAVRRAAAKVFVACLYATGDYHHFIDSRSAPVTTTPAAAAADAPQSSFLRLIGHKRFLSETFTILGDPAIVSHFVYALRHSSRSLVADTVLPLVVKSLNKLIGNPKSTPALVNAGLLSLAELVSWTTDPAAGAPLDVAAAVRGGDRFAEFAAAIAPLLPAGVTTTTKPAKSKTGKTKSQPPLTSGSDALANAAAPTAAAATAATAAATALPPPPPQRPHALSSSLCVRYTDAIVAAITTALMARPSAVGANAVLALARICTAAAAAAPAAAAASAGAASDAKGKPEASPAAAAAGTAGSSVWLSVAVNAFAEVLTDRLWQHTTAKSGGSQRNESDDEPDDDADGSIEVRLLAFHVFTGLCADANFVSHVLCTASARDAICSSLWHTLTTRDIVEPVVFDDDPALRRGQSQLLLTIAAHPQLRQFVDLKLISSQVWAIINQNGTAKPAA